MEDKNNGKRQEISGGDHLDGGGFRAVVHGRGEEGGAVRLLECEGLYDHQARGLCDLGADPAAARRGVQEDGRGECVHADVHTGKPSGKGEGSR